MRIKNVLRGGIAAISIVMVGPPSASAAITFTQPENSVSTPRFELDFANSTFEPERVDSVKWRGSAGTLGPNLVANGGTGCNGAGIREFWGQSYGDTDFATPNPVVSGVIGTWSPVSGRTLELNTSTPTACSGDTVATPVRTRYSFYDTGSTADMIRVERRWSFSAANPTYNGVGMRAYTPRLPSGTYNQVVHPNEAGTALVTDGLGCNGGCGTGAADDDWNGTWLAFNSAASNAGVVVLRDPSNATTASGVRLVRDSDGFSGSNNSGVSILRTASNQKAPLTEVEYLCFYDVTSWPLANRSATQLPPGCEPKPVPINTALPSVLGNAGNPQPGDVLSALNGSWDNSNGTFSFQWSRCEGDVCLPIFGATDRNYTATIDDFGRRLKVAVTATASGGETDTASSTFAGSISGRVYVGNSSPGNRLGGAPVQVCEAAGTVCRSTVTDGEGFYKIQLPHSGDWRISAFPPAGSDAIRATRPTPTSVVDGQESTGQDLILLAPAPPPSNVSFSGSGYRSSTSAGVPVLHWQEPVVIRYKVPSSGWTVDGSIEYPGEDPTPLSPGPFVPDPSPPCPSCGHYEFSVPPQQPKHGPGTIVFNPKPPPDAPPPPDDPDDPNTPPGSSAFPVYIDPSGYVRTTTGEPIIGANVVLYRSETRGGDKQVVADGSAEMSPMNRKNPDVTDSGGHFGWDVIAGYYKVRVTADGCYAPSDPSKLFVDTDEMEIPPPVTNLDIRLECPNPPTGKAALTLPKKAGKVKVDKKGKFKIRRATVGCPTNASGPCEISLGVTAKTPKKSKKKLKLGNSSFELSAGQSGALKGKLSKKGARLVKRARKIKKATIKIAVAVPGGEAATATSRGTLVAKR